MDKTIEQKRKIGEVTNCYIHPEVKNYDELEQKCDELSKKWQEVKQLVAEVQNMNLPIEFFQSLE